MPYNKLYISGIAFVLGFFVIVQGRSFDNVSNLLMRDTHSNVFQEIKILKEKNEDLKHAIDELENAVEQLTDQNSALDVVEAEVNKYMKLSGKTPIYGSGVEVTVDGDITTPWAVDLINAFYSSGAQAVSLNGIRIVNSTAGLDTLPQGQILLNGSILSSPYVFSAIGEPADLSEIIQLPGGIVDRLRASFKDLKVEILPRKIIKME